MFLSDIIMVTITVNSNNVTQFKNLTDILSPEIIELILKYMIIKLLSINYYINQIEHLFSVGIAL